MRNSIIKRILKIILSLVGVVSALLGMLLLFSTAQSYLRTGAFQDLPMQYFLPALTFIGAPTAVYFLYKSRHSLLRFQNEYSLPDAPLNSIIFVVLTTVFGLMALVSLVMYIVLFRS